MKRIVLMAVVLATGGLGPWVAPPALAEPFWSQLVTTNRVEADPNKDYVMTAKNGPWMILATAFSGEGAEDQARDLVLELRKRYKLEAYLHAMTFDFTEGVEGRGVDATGQPTRMQYQRDKEVREIAVLVGNYPDINDPAAQATLRKIKFMKPDALTPKERDATSQSLASLRTIQRALLPDDDERKQKGPMGHALITRNPMIPKEYFVPQGVDKFVEKINSDVRYSLLECPKKFTVKVATFTGKVVIDQHKIEAYENGASLGASRLAKAGEDAETLAIALRQKGYEAYVLHDRNLSMVTIGSFDSVGTPREDGKTEINPQIHAIMRTFAAKPLTLPNTQSGAQPQSAYEPKSLAGIPFDLQPQIVQIPRRSISSDYSRR